ncbi:hypothetical protein M440DRAFT_1246173 [Trichoderma longibrachiatum ATCC 18648]|uniref:Uncharacterized protein n=1 Tax=Trichoderma longibrachiatum ATCC 18648 TaxID=983965 RepID=A0A2T4C3H5_TRILO|nr:hypothetical protein M440DRAFT_1246173 [Trichoderma longibrachiatum ATCC 18648]
MQGRWRRAVHRVKSLASKRWLRVIESLIVEATADYFTRPEASSTVQQRKVAAVQHLQRTSPPRYGAEPPGAFSSVLLQSDTASFDLAQCRPSNVQDIPACLACPDSNAGVPVLQKKRTACHQPKPCLSVAGDA